jgi:hypothetical protein
MEEIEVLDKILVAFVSGVFGILIAYIKWYLDNKKIIQEVKPDIKLDIHPLFSRIEYIISQIDYSIEFDDVGKSRLISDVMEKNFKAIKCNLRDMAEEVEELERESEDYDMYNIHMKYLNRIINEYTDTDNYSEYGIDKQSRKTLEVFLNRFQLWQESRILLLIERASEINSSKFYKSDKVKVAALFDTYIGILAHTLQDGSKTLNSINGHLTGKVYRGEEIDH